MTDIPIKDAITVAHVGIAHALSHVKEWTEAEKWDVADLMNDLHDIQNDLERALEMTRPHCREAR